MNIKLNDKYSITSDKHRNIILEEKVIRQPRDNDKDPYESSQVSGYFPKFEYLLKFIFDNKIITSNVESLEDLQQLILSIKKEIKDMTKEIDDQFKTMPLKVKSGEE